MEWVDDVRSFYDFIGYVVVRAPNAFPLEDFLPSDEQMNLDRAFAELRRGLEITGHANGPVAASMAERLLEQSLAAYKAGDEVKGAHLLNDMERTIFKKKRI